MNNDPDHPEHYLHTIAVNETLTTDGHFDTGGALGECSDRPIRRARWRIVVEAA